MIDDAVDAGRAVGFEPPKAYALTGAFMQIRICERFGIDPFGPWWESLRDGERGVLLAYERMRLSGVGD